MSGTADAWRLGQQQREVARLFEDAGSIRHEPFAVAASLTDGIVAHSALLVRTEALRAEAVGAGAHAFEHLDRVESELGVIDRLARRVHAALSSVSEFDTEVASATAELIAELGPDPS